MMKIDWSLTILLTLCFAAFLHWLIVPASAQSATTQELRNRRVRAIHAMAATRRLERMKQVENHIASVESSIAGLRRAFSILMQETEKELCSLNFASYCPKPEPEPEVSTGHTTLVRFDVDVTFYNNDTAQTDASPCEGAAGNVCDAHKKGLNPIAASRDIFRYPLNPGSKVQLESKSDRRYCKALEGKTFTVMDTMNRRFKNRLDVFLPCEDSLCTQAKARALRYGLCQMAVKKL